VFFDQLPLVAHAPCRVPPALATPGWLFARLSDAYAPRAQLTFLTLVEVRSLYLHETTAFASGAAPA
jgi:hypothetical protein